MDTNTRMAAIEVVDLSKVYPSPEGPLVVLNNISFNVRSTESVAILGVSGSGKSTLLALLAGLDTPSAGTVNIFGAALSAANEDERAALRNKYIGFVFQQFHLLPNLTALENVALPLEIRGDRNALHRAREVLAEVGLDARRQHFPRQLSGGEQQRVALARAYCARPRILFADEPTGNLDKRTAERVVQLLFALNDEHETTLVLVTHDATLASRCARRLSLDNGIVVND